MDPPDRSVKRFPPGWLNLSTLFGVLAVIASIGLFSAGVSSPDRMRDLFGKRPTTFFGSSSFSGSFTSASFFDRQDFH